MAKKFLSHGTWRNVVWTEHKEFPKGAVNYLRRVQNSQNMAYMKNYTIHIYEWTPEAEHMREIPESEWTTYMEEK